AQSFYHIWGSPKAGIKSLWGDSYFRGKAVAQGLAWAQCPPGYAPNVPHHSIKTQVLSASLPEFSKEIGPAPVEVVHHLVQGAIRRKVGLTDNVQCPLGSRDHRSGRYEPYPPGQGIDL